MGRVQADGGFIQDKQGGIVNQSLGQTHPLAVPVGEVAHQAPPHVTQAGQLDDAVEVLEVEATETSRLVKSDLANLGLGGLLLGIELGLVLGLDYLDHTLRSPDQVENYLGLETLTALPKMTDDNARVLRESFQSLRTAVMLAARGEG